MFNRKKTEETPKTPDYTNWEKDLGFLTLILTRKKNITKEYLINIYSKQKSDRDYLKDEEIEPIINNIIIETVEQIGSKYLNFIIEKYFGTRDNLIKFITEDVYVDLTSDAINRNIKKITTTLQNQKIGNLKKLNKDTTKK